jgi:predicted Na+-dependent transporter
VVLVVASGLGIPAGSAQALRDVAVRLVVVVATVSVVLPLLADGFAHLLGAGPLRDGVLAVGVAPAEVASIGLSGLAGGDVAVAATLLGASTLVSVATAGPILSLLGGGGVAPGHVIVQLVVIVALPLVVGLLARPIVATGPAPPPPATGAAPRPPATGPAPPPRATGPAPRPPATGPARPASSGSRGPRLVASAPGLVATVAVLVLVGLVAAQVHLASAYLTVTGVLVALILVSAGGGWLLGRLLPRRAARSALLHVSMRDFAIASGIASAAFGAGATGPLGIYGVLVIGWGTLVATWSARRQLS